MNENGGWSALSMRSFGGCIANRVSHSDTETKLRPEGAAPTNQKTCIPNNDIEAANYHARKIQPPLVTDPEFCARHLILPGENGKWDHRYASCNAKDGTALLGALAEEKYEKFSFSYIPKDALVRTIESRFGQHIVENAAWRLAWEDPACSAHLGILRGQKIILLLCLSAIFCCAVLLPDVTLVASLWGIGIIFAVMTAFRFALLAAGAVSWQPIHYAARGADEEYAGSDTQTPASSLFADLPVYTILAPLYDEPEIVPQLIEALSDLDYPPDLLDIKLLLEEDDARTLAAIQTFNLPPYFELLHVPALAPRTKPKACNYGLAFARGEFTVIYDAEDIPDPDQLRRAVAKFARSGPETACLQARLNFYNQRDNWLTRQFTLEYSMWFDLLLPGLKRLGLPIPLGGTSNHFRTDVLRAIGGWDPYNVTEDADLGLRLARRGYRCSILNSTTYEEANSETFNWLRQRSRWQKGYMMTWLVHMRHPIWLARQLGLWRTLGFHLFFGGTVLLAICTPLALPLLLSGLILSLDPMLKLLKFGTLIGGFATLLSCAIAGALCRGNYDLVKDVWRTPFYWLLTMAANIRAVWQLFQCPFYWEKTRHGLNLLKPHQNG